MARLKITIGNHQLIARMEEKEAPKTCEAFKKNLPFISKVIHVRWSGEAMWVPLGERDFGVEFENHTSHPSRGDILLYPGGISETELLIPYGSCCFASKVGQLAGNHFLTIEEGLEHLPSIGKDVLWSGSKELIIEELT